MALAGSGGVLHSINSLCQGLRRVLFMECCYSGSAVPGMTAQVQKQQATHALFCNFRWRFLTSVVARALTQLQC